MTMRKTGDDCDPEVKPEKCAQCERDVCIHCKDEAPAEPKK